MSSVTFSIIQTSLFWQDAVANRDMLEKKIAGITGIKEIVLLPEMFNTGFTTQMPQLAETMDGPTVQWMKEMAVTHKIILGGSLMVLENEQLYNRFIWMQPNGQYGHYDKRHLFSYANEEEHFSAGNRRVIASVKGWKINLQVCYDLRFPVWARQAAHTPSTPNEKELPGCEYDVLINIANWPASRSLAWKTLLRARAIENQCYVIGVNRVGADGNSIAYSGDSCIIDALGNTIFEQADEAIVKTITLYKEDLEAVRRQFPFLQDGDAFRIM